MQIEDLSQQAQMAAAEKFKAPDAANLSTTADASAAATTQPAAQEESDDEVFWGFLNLNVFKVQD